MESRQGGGRVMKRFRVFSFAGANWVKETDNEKAAIAAAQRLAREENRRFEVYDNGQRAYLAVPGQPIADVRLPVTTEITLRLVHDPAAGDVAFTVLNGGEVCGEGASPAEALAEAVRHAKAFPGLYVSSGARR